MQTDNYGRNQRYGRQGGCGVRVLLALAVAGIALFSYCSNAQINPVTGEKQHVAGVRPEQEIALGLQAAPSMVQEYGGVSRDQEAAGRVEWVGNQVVSNSDAQRGPYQYKFHLLADRKTINAFALPGGQVFITEALYRQLTSDGQLAGVLGHEIGHVVARHGAEHMAKAQLTQGLTGAAVLATYDPDRPGSASSAAIAQMVGGLLNLKYGRDDELESDRLGVRFMTQAGYDPRSMIAVMEILKKSGGGSQPEFFSTHPNPENRIGKIQQAIKDEFPNGLPDDLKR